MYTGSIYQVRRMQMRPLAKAQRAVDTRPGYTDVASTGDWYMA